MRAEKTTITQGYARMWPRAVFERAELEDGKRSRSLLARQLQFLEEGGVYILYRDDEPYYIGQADKLRHRLKIWARHPDSRYYHLWNFFSAFSVKNKVLRNELEAILIASMPTANSATPKLNREKMPTEVRALLKKYYANR
jgi:hypothetical protein